MRRTHARDVDIPDPDRIYSGVALSPALCFGLPPRVSVGSIVLTISHRAPSGVCRLVSLIRLVAPSCSRATRSSERLGSLRILWSTTNTRRAVKCACAGFRPPITPLVYASTSPVCVWRGRPCAGHLFRPILSVRRVVAWRARRARVCTCVVLVRSGGRGGGRQRDAAAACKVVPAPCVGVERCGDFAAAPANAMASAAASNLCTSRRDDGRDCAHGADTHHALALALADAEPIAERPREHVAVDLIGGAILETQREGYLELVVVSRVVARRGGLVAVARRGAGAGGRARCSSGRPRRARTARRQRVPRGGGGAPVAPAPPRHSRRQPRQRFWLLATASPGGYCTSAAGSEALATAGWCTTAATAGASASAWSVSKRRCFGGLGFLSAVLPSRVRILVLARCFSTTKNIHENVTRDVEQAANARNGPATPIFHPTRLQAAIRGI